MVLENAKLRRFNHALAITAQADPAPGVDLAELFARIRPGIEAIKLPTGYTLEWRGEFGNSRDAHQGLMVALPFSFGAMVIIVFILFNAVRQPLIVYFTVPLAFIGVIYGLILTETPMEFMALVAMLSLAGLLIKNVIILIDEIDTQIREGRARTDAVLDATVSRVRPVYLTTLTTVWGVTPLLWDPCFKSLAVVIICGLSLATVLTLVVVPAIYAVFFRIRCDEGSR